VQAHRRDGRRPQRAANVQRVIDRRAGQFAMSRVRTSDYARRSLVRMVQVAGESLGHVDCLLAPRREAQYNWLTLEGLV
jgi:hypothetical protein